MNKLTMAITVFLVALGTGVGYIGIVNITFIHLKMECNDSRISEHDLRNHDFRLKEYGRYESHLKWTVNKRVKYCKAMYEYDYNNRSLIWTPFDRGWLK